VAMAIIIKMQSDSTEAFENKLKHLKDFLSLNQG
jgi:hypothetical protein